MDIVDNVVNEFNLQELIKIAECVSISPISTWGSRKLVDTINSRLYQGIPNLDKLKDNVKPLFLDFLYVAGYTDENNEMVEESIKEDSNDVVGIHVVLKELGIDSVPDCFSYVDDQDPACKRCPIFKHCAEYRISNLPPCYGHLFSEINSKCQECMEATLCRLSEKQGKSRQAEIVVNFS